MNVGRLQEQDQSSWNELVDEREWTVIHSSLMGLPVEEAVRSLKLPRLFSFTPFLPSIDEENEDNY